MSALFELPAPDSEVRPERYTERQMLDALHGRYSQSSGNGDRWVCAEHVRSAAGFDATRCADFLAQDLWPSNGLALHGHEVKVSRSDWLTELRDPSKAEAFKRYCDRWWLAVPDPSIVRDDLPTGWGLLVWDGSKWRIAKRAAALNPEPMPVTLRAALLRAVAKTATRRAAKASA